MKSPPSRFWFCTLVLISVIFFRVPSHADERSFGFSSFPEEFDIIKGSTPVERVLRLLTTRALLIPGYTDPPSRHLDLANSIQRRKLNEGDVLEITLIQDATFGPRHPVRLVDVVASLQKCKQRGILSEARYIKSRSALQRLGNESLGSLETGSILIELEPLEGSSGEGIIDDLSLCPIVEKSSLLAFGNDYGYGTNLVSAGKFLISDFRPGRLIRLKEKSLESRRGVSSDVVLRAYEKEEQALSALRIGNIEAFVFEESSLVHTEAQGDPTLRVGACDGFFMLTHVSQELDCDFSQL